MKITQLVKRLAYRLGVDVRRALPLPESGEVPSFWDPFHEQRRLLRGSRRPVIFDVGGHWGQTVVTYKGHFPDACIYSFEPFPDSFARLAAVAGGFRDVHPVPCALGKAPGEAVLNVNRGTATNSLLPTDPRASATWNGADVTETVSSVTTPVETLDGFLRAHPEVGAVDILKLDAQGSEMDILVGAEEALGKGLFALVYLEIIVLPTYVGQRALDEYLALFRRHAYGLHNLYNPCYTNDGALSQVDALFVRGAQGRS